MLNGDQIAAFDRDGYVRLGPVFSADEVAAMRDALDEVAARELREPDDSSPEFAFGHRRKGTDYDPGSRAITQFVNVWKRHPAFAAAIRKPLLVEAAKALLRSPSMRVWHDQIISKPPGDNGHFQFHQDFYFWPLSHPALASAWIALDEATPENGCMHVLPGSHLDERFTPEARARELASPPEGETERQQMAKLPAAQGKPVALPAGEAMFHHCLNWHCTPPNRTDRQRRALVVIYMAEGVCYNPDQSGQHILVPTIAVAPGEPLVGDGFPLVG